METQPTTEKRIVKIRLDAPEPAETPVQKPVAVVNKTGIQQHEINCIASAVWHEARNQPEAGQIAVAEVVLQRRENKRYPNDACEVITQRKQFSFVRAGRIPSIPVEDQRDMHEIADGVANGRLRSHVKGAMFFHATYVSPDWGRPKIGQVGDHVFYR